MIYLIPLTLIGIGIWKSDPLLIFGGATLLAVIVVATFIWMAWVFIQVRKARSDFRRRWWA